jgi:hypothetical protein
MPKEWGYYHVDCGHFPAQIKLCFSNDMFQRVLKDYGITLKTTALDDGVAETHYLTDGKQGVIVLVFDLEECVDEDPAFLAGIIAHEATHCVCRVFEHIGEEPDEIGEESRAYLTEHIVKQITTGIMMEMEKNARKANRAVSKQKGKGEKRPDVQVDKHDNGSAGSDSVPKQKGSPDRAQDKDGSAVGKAKDSLPAAGGSGVRGGGNKKQRGG